MNPRIVGCYESATVLRKLCCLAFKIAQYYLFVSTLSALSNNLVTVITVDKCY